MESTGVEREYFENLRDYVYNNYRIAEFYRRYDKEYNCDGQHNLLYYNKAESIDSCARYWDLDYYRIQYVKDIKSVNLCRDKFCYNCQSFLALKRQNKFAPELDRLAKKYSVYHVVFTVPNVPYSDDDSLKTVIKQMYSRFRHLIRFLAGDVKVHGVDFLKYGYRGCLRALEVTTNAELTFHPHFHCMFIMPKGIMFEKTVVNQYSFSYGSLVRRFSDFEILLQKVWYLLYNNIPVTRVAIDDLAVGYSVIADPVQDGDYHEVFKYAVKGAFKDGSIYNYDVFKQLYRALYRRRMIQGYGCLYNYADDFEAVFEAEVEDEYQAMINELRYLEDPFHLLQSLDDCISDQNCRYVSKMNIKRTVRQRMMAEGWN